MEKFANVAVILSDLSKAKKVVRVERGAYYRPKQSSWGLGVLPIYQDEQLNYLTRKLDGYLTGAYIYNKMSLTEQAPSIFTIAMKQPVRSFKFKKLSVECVKAYVDTPDDENTLYLIRIPRKNFLPGPGFVIINWSGENGPWDNPYAIEYTYKAYDEYGNLLNIDASEIGKATPTSCFGGNFESSTSCSVNPEYRALREGPGIGGGLEVLEDDLGQHDDTGDKYEVFSCPSSNYICPGYGQKITSYEQFPDGIREVVFQRIAKPVGVTVKGVDLIEKPNIEQEKNMTVMSAEGEIPNVQIKWYSENATNCTCTKSTGGGCGTGVSPVVTEAVYATGEGVVDLGGPEGGGSGGDGGTGGSIPGMCSVNGILMPCGPNNNPTYNINYTYYLDDVIDNSAGSASPSTCTEGETFRIRCSPSPGNEVESCPGPTYCSGGIPFENEWFMEAIGVYFSKITEYNPLVRIFADDDIVPYGGETVVRWRTENVKKCNRDLLGSLRTGPLYENTTYEISYCTIDSSFCPY